MQSKMPDSPEKLKSVLKLIADDLCVRILLEIKRSDIYSDALSEKLGIPKSTVWKKLNELEKAGVVESYFTTATVGRRVKMYRFKDREIGFKSVSDILRVFEQK